MIYDCFTFYNELDLLEIRLHELASVVDYFVLVEAEQRFDTQKKPLYYWDNRFRFEQFKDKIIHIALKNLVGNGLEERGVYQHNQIMRALDKAKDNDLIIISDGDEIVKAEELRKFHFIKGPYRPIHQPMYVFFMNWFWTERWNGSVITSYNFLTSHLKTPRQARLDRRKGIYVRKGGWHFSQMGTEEDAVVKRLNSYHFEYENLSVEEIKGARNMGQMWLTKRHAGKISTQRARTIEPSTDTHPKYFMDNLAKFNHMIGGKI